MKKGIFKKEFDSHKELFKFSGHERYDAIRVLPLKDRHFICGFYKQCAECPVALYFKDGHGLCSISAGEADVRSAITYGAEFVTEVEAREARENNS